MALALDDLLATPGERTGKPPIGRAVVLMPPASPLDSIYVALVDGDRSNPFEVIAGNWAVREGLLPLKGTVCLLIFDHHGDAWVPIWHGHDTAGLLFPSEALYPSEGLYP